MRKDFNSERGNSAKLNLVKDLFEQLPAKDQAKMLEGHRDTPSAVHLPTIEEQKGGTTTRWDLFSRLLSERIIRVDGQVEGAMAAVVQASLQFLDFQDSKSPIRMIINSPGGSVLDGLAMYDTMREIEAPVHTQGYGNMASMGSLLLAGGDKRYASKNSFIMIHEVGSQNQGKFSDMDAAMEFTSELYKKLVDVYVAHSGIPEEKWYPLLERDNWLTPDEAIELGLVDEIIPYAKTAPFQDMVDDSKKLPAKPSFNEVTRPLIKQLGAERRQMIEDMKASKAGNDNATPASSKKVLKGPKNGM